MLNAIEEEAVVPTGPSQPNKVWSTFLLYHIYPNMDQFDTEYVPYWNVLVSYEYVMHVCTP